MRSLRSLLVVLATAALVAPAAPAAAARPFTFDVTAQASFVPTTTPGVLAGTISGTGRASHLGRVTISTTETLDLASSPGSIVVGSGRLVMVAANGDELHWSYEGTGTLPDAEGNSAIGGTFVVTGGTGRFSDATGSGSFEGEGNVATGVASVSYRGTIDY